MSGKGLVHDAKDVIGLALVLERGASRLVAPSAKSEERDESHMLNGPGNAGGQGSAIPLIYGEVMTGSVLVSFDADIEDYSVYSGGAGSVESGLA